MNEHLQSSSSSLSVQFEQLSIAFASTPYLSINKRIALLKLLRKQLIPLEQAFINAVSKDFGYRSAFDTTLGDILPTIQSLTHITHSLNKWAKPSHRKVGLSLWPSKVMVQYQPKGVVGVIAPWNYPIQLALVPVITAIAAGNRVMLKLSEFTPNTNQVIKQLFSQELAEHCCVVEGGSEVASTFSSLPFAHLLFTGSTGVGKLVMAAASKNLTPVTLELGGKSPVIITKDADIIKAAKIILFGKMANAGQICVAPDYIFVAKQQESALIKALCELYKKHYKLGVEGKNLTSIVNQSHYQRLVNYLSQAQAQGANVIKPLEQNQQDEQKHRLGLHLVTNVNDDMALMQEELFGPILPIKTYQHLDETIAYVNEHPHPLALYIIGDDKHAQANIMQRTISGTLAINDALVQVTADDAPFGGVGDSGLGHYHGKEGFLTFSHAKNTLVSSQFNPRINMLLKQSKFLITLLKKLYIK
ncbi:coniferyl aldehyde dehydrogenase [Pseudoalteromonas sp. MMG010]|uniref:coniferyl aldehyde dehydrogenase n=1 Tax=Pseudoalteromonas sp. MMG010 TaxID=2822685 RepID=UPI001FFD8738|nr:coniferyl aldehyde dehydrogenase [Pseudoalteromonas sp. MMG010]